MNMRNVTAMVPLGRFLELSVPAPDIQESLGFYLRLGFTEIPTNDIRSHSYAAVSDGRIVIGLHGARIDEPTLTFVQPELSRQVQRLIEAGSEPAYRQLDADSFNEAAVIGPDGHRIMMIEARTFSQTDLAGLPPATCGNCVGVALRCADPERATVFWENAGFTLGAESDTSRELIAPGLALRLDDNERDTRPVLLFRVADRDTAIAGIEAADIAVQTRGDHAMLQSPEGTRLRIL